MKPNTAKELLEKVKNDYSVISKEFSDTRKWLWPEFEFFKKYIRDGFSVADVGCGNGRLIKLFKDYTNIIYVGVDNNQELIAHAQKTNPRTNFICNNLNEFKLPAKVDIMFAIASLHHVPSSHMRNKCIHNLSTNIKQEGVLILTVWNLFQLRYLKYILQSLYNYIIHFGRYDWNDTFIPWGDTNVNRYYHAFTPKELRKLFQNNGFEIIEMFYTKKGKKTYFWNSHNICIICRKK